MHPCIANGMAEDTFTHTHIHTIHAHAHTYIVYIHKDIIVLGGGI